ncbi:MAG: hypothetical protein GAK33_05296 [Burkholderia lata]|uniref:DUF4123 domain-containing protein n=1 Tax=Burkholderia lata (strain ATCC 17760 / DSM 23089 / LMG 22485 / NCIMB 9086 / R18194 / 383) TaxID=482957 RepID=A0A833PPL0_BURL3|nr:DUF4123 domain-containing protein [Burkholderia lata]KAF1034766.1 MAG: hypothetical protein GAK33_05296 [Burkholderia lata]
MAMNENGTLYGLVDGAQYPEALATWVLEFSLEVRSLFDGLPEEEAGNAAPILFEIDDATSDWVCQIDQMDQYRPCFTVVRSALNIDQLKTHLQRFLFVDIGDGMQVLLRWFDPRSLPAILEVWGTTAQAELTRPMALWMYRGGRSEWQHVGIDKRASAADAGEFPLFLSQRQLDELERHDEPHALMSELSDLGLIDTSQSYATRYQNFLRRYNRAGEWALTSRADRHAFCMGSYQYGESFDRHDEIRAAIRSSVASRAPLVQSFDMVPAYVWRELMRSGENKTKALQEWEVGK